MEPMIFTHAGKLGDFIYTLPIASWFYKTTGRKVHFVLPEPFGPFRLIESLLMLQPFTDRVTLVDYHVADYGCGGQPYRFNPADFGVPGEYRNFGLRDYPRKYVSEFQAEEHGYAWDREFVLQLGEEELRTDEVLVTEHSAFWVTKGMPVFLPEQVIDVQRTVLYNARRFRSAYERHCFYSGLAVILYFARVPFRLYKHAGHGPVESYFPDTSRYELKMMVEDAGGWKLL